MDQLGEQLVTVLAPAGALMEQLTVALEPVVTPSQALFAEMDKPLAVVSELASFPMDQLRVLACLICSTPLAFVFARFTPLPPAFKHVVSILLGLLFSFYTIGAQTIHSFVSSLIVYLLVALFNGRGFAHKLVFVFAMLYMSISHIYRMHVEYVLCVFLCCECMCMCM
jgi:hypothetical protein